MQEKIERLQMEFRSQMDELKEDYFTQMRKLHEIPDQIPKAQMERDREKIMAGIDAKMVELGKSFAAKANAIMENFIRKLTED